MPSLAKFTILSKNSQAYKTFITQEMLKNGFLAANGVYMCIAHNNKILKRYEIILDEIFHQISRCEKDQEKIENILKSPISHIPFTRLN